MTPRCFSFCSGNENPKRCKLIAENTGEEFIINVAILGEERAWEEEGHTKHIPAKGTDRRTSISLHNSAVRFESIISFPVSGWIGPSSGCGCRQPFTPWMSCTDSQLYFVVAKRKQTLCVAFGAESGNSLNPLFPCHPDVPGQPQMLHVDCSPTVR